MYSVPISRKNLFTKWISFQLNYSRFYSMNIHRTCRWMFIFGRLTLILPSAHTIPKFCPDLQVLLSIENTFPPYSVANIIGSLAAGFNIQKARRSSPGVKFILSNNKKLVLKNFTIG